jgi:hypothetical protein
VAASFEIAERDSLLESKVVAAWVLNSAALDYLNLKYGISCFIKFEIFCGIFKLITLKNGDNAAN